MIDLEITLDGKKIKLSTSEAEALYRELDRFFGNKQFAPYTPSYPLSPAPSLYPRPLEIWCGGSTAAQTITSDLKQ